MYTIIPLLLAHIQELNKQILFLFKFIVKNIPLNLEKSKDDSLFSPKYNKLKVDKLPIIHVPEKKDYKQLLEQYIKEHGKPLKPIKSRGKNPVPDDVHCPCCNAPHIYIYDNTGGRGQFSCKICSTNFSRYNWIDNPIELHCPHCGHALSLEKKRKLFNIHKCRNNNCSYYQNSLKALSKNDMDEYKSNPEKFKLHYIYREFKIDFFKVDLYSLPKNASTLQFRKFSPHIMGLALTYLINCGMSTRATARVLREVHGVKISHTQIANYATTAAYCVKPFVDSYDYKPTNYLAADETYTKVKGSRRYVWFIMDAIKKSILGYRSSSSRDTTPCILAMRMAFDKFKKFPGKALKFVADGYTAYKLAQQQIALHGMHFDVTQVIGLTNEDDVSTEYRWLKQIIERLNRTFKSSYKITNGYGSDDGASTHLVLFVAYYNFLRPHSYTYWKPLNEVPELEKSELMPAKWQLLIELSQQLILEKQKT
ncbi:MAG: DDE-type integrase/transposase/recombinase [Firmicutes bacterium]|nr:DDE-type integrase/transposase/recombinase [Candidatus Alectryobacillus merdavium]